MMRALAHAHSSAKREDAAIQANEPVGRARRTASVAKQSRATATVTRTLRWRLRAGLSGVRPGEVLAIPGRLVLLCAASDSTRTPEGERSRDDQHPRRASKDRAGEPLAGELGVLADPVEGVAEVAAGDQGSHEGARLGQDQPVDGL